MDPPYVFEPLGVDGIARIRYTSASVITEAVARRAMVELEHAGRDQTVAASARAGGLAVA